MDQLDNKLHNPASKQSHMFAEQWVQNYTNSEEILMSFVQVLFVCLCRGLTFRQAEHCLAI
jgi:hypothetical protein